MSIMTKIAWNTLVHTLGKFGGSAIGVLIVAMLTRYLGVAGYGAYTTIFAYLFFFAILADLGLYVVMVNELGRSPYGEEKFFNNIFTLRVMSGLIFMVVACLLVWIFPYEKTVKIGVIIIAWSIFLSLLDQMIVAFCQNKIDMRRVAVAEIIGKLVLFILTAIIVYAQGSLSMLLWAVVVGFALNFGININYLKRFIKLRLSFDKVIWRDILKKSWPIAVTSVFSLIYFKADTLLLSLLPVNAAYALSNNEAVGIYGAPYKILEVLIVWPAIFMGLVSPLLAKAVKVGDESSTGSFAPAKVGVQDNSFAIIFQRAFDALSIIIWPLMVGTLVLAKPLMIFIAGEPFASSALILQILIWAVGIIFISHLTTYAIIALGRQKEMIKFYVAAAILAVIGYLIFIPLYSYLGAAIMTVAVEGFMLMSTFYLLRKIIKLKINLAIFGRAILAAVGMGFILSWLGNWHVLALIIVGAFFYLGILWALRGIDKKIIGEFTGERIIRGNK